eukprot:CAMPEP_0116021830 /NCGR_PEP_ID=MMETSP0321-20121206/10622_1 /TAXON_ID=163516 /ORGANISM="Leptocylindrus danicus var. danicus, Strain B650" /LENGTH=242 /DNA_ID=CAMNT_0003492779 /DNA_START=180 /DNA_END=908 /DNA_ORIENTATION=+
MRVAAYMCSALIGALGATYASVPLYKIFCQATGFGGTTKRVDLDDLDHAIANSDQTIENTSKKRTKMDRFFNKLYSMSNVPGLQKNNRGHANTWTDEEAAQKLAQLKPHPNGRLIRVRFDATVGDVMPWSFTPTQRDVRVVPGETSLAFFTAKNNSDKPMTGVATYNVFPAQAGVYFNKIQCFCFEEQRLLPGEEVDMPVFFFIDPEYVDDAALANCNNVVLSYTFFPTDWDDDEDDEDDDE